MVQTSNVAHLRQVSRGLLHAIYGVFPFSAITGHAGDDPVSIKQLLEEEGTWDVRKEILGWVFDGAKRCIELLVKKLEAITSELRSILRLQYILYKSFEKNVGKFRQRDVVYVPHSTAPYQCTLPKYC